MTATTFQNGNTYSYVSSVRTEGSESVYNLLRWTVEGVHSEARLYQGSETGREMHSQMAAAYSLASGVQHVMVNGVMTPLTF